MQERESRETRRGERQKRKVLFKRVEEETVGKGEKTRRWAMIRGEMMRHVKMVTLYTGCCENVTKQTTLRLCI